MELRWLKWWLGFSGGFAGDGGLQGLTASRLVVEEAEVEVVGG